jgi:pimeloyl-ACP methyl ester carboxylesterase
VTTADSADDKIDGIRDLEDFARLKINLNGLQNAVRQGQIRIGLKWKGAPGSSGAAGIKLWRNLSPNGGTEYLTDVAVARQHLALREPGTVQGALNYLIPTQYWVDVGVGDSQPYGNLLFEGISAGKDELVITLNNPDGSEISESGGIWLDLKNIKSMYERATATANGAEDFPFPYNYVGASVVPNPTMGWVPDPNGYPFQSASDESATYIVFVHGWNQTYERSVMYAETMFKRLWHRGYRGRFAAFRWPTFTGAASYNDSEYRAWKCGVSLKQYLASLPGTYTVNLVAHSMGNIVAGSALEKGASVAKYALLNSVAPAICFDTSGTVVQTAWGYVTPNDDPDPATVALSYQGRLSNVSGNLINFFLPNDSALALWELNNDSPVGGRYPLVGSKPHQWPEENMSNAGYSYLRTAAAGQKLKITLVGGQRTLASTDEAMAFAVQASSLTVGADGRTRGSIHDWTDMTAYGFDSVHSAEFLFTIQQTRDFYGTLLLKFGVAIDP